MLGPRVAIFRLGGIVPAQAMVQDLTTPVTARAVVRTRVVRCTDAVSEAGTCTSTSPTVPKLRSMARTTQVTSLPVGRLTR